jgi:hypothetical protein
MNQRALAAWTLAAAGLVAILLGGIVLVPRLLYPPLTAAYLRGVPSVQSRIQLPASPVPARQRRTLGRLAGPGRAAGRDRRHRHLAPGPHQPGRTTHRRFSCAVDQLGSPNADVRIGALYALERTARNSPADRKQVVSLTGKVQLGFSLRPRARTLAKAPPVRWPW